MRVNFHVIRFLIAIATIISAAPVFASDGQLEINQACAVNTGCFPGDDPGFPVTIIQPGSYRLTGSLDLSAVDSSLNGIEVSAPAVTVDLGGFHIVGSTTCSGSGASISCSPSITGAGSGVQFMNNATASVVQNGIVRNMTNSGIFSLATGSRVQNITATHNGIDGIFAQQGTLVVNSVAIENGQDGINVTAGSMVDGVTSIGNGQNGIHAEGFSGGSVVTRAIARNNGARGFMLFGLPKFGKNNLSVGNELADSCAGGICTERRRIYLTKTLHQGDTVLTACRPGFHVASKTELIDVGQYDYDETIGATQPDSGSGIPTYIWGWRRGSSKHGIPSFDSCNAWTSTGSMTSAYTTGFTEPDQALQSTSISCAAFRAVWCVE